MSSGIQSKGIDLDAIFDPYVQGTSPGLTGIQSAGADINTRYAPLSFGTQAAATGITCKPGGSGSAVDLNTLFAAYGTANYPLGMNGQTYVSDGGRGTQTVSLTFNTDGTWTIAAHTSGTPLSGNWFSFGGALSDYSVQFVMTGFANGADPSGGSDAYSNGASSAVALTAARSCSCSSSATTVGTNAANGGTVTIKLYKGGVLVSTSTCTFDTSAAG